MSWGLGWKRPSETFHLRLTYGSEDDTLDDVISSGGAATVSAKNNEELLRFQVDLDWNAGEDEDQAALRLQSQVMADLPPPKDTVKIELRERTENGEENLGNSVDGEGNLENSVGEGVGVVMRVVTRRELLNGVIMSRGGGSGQQSDGGMGVLLKLTKMNLTNGAAEEIPEGPGFAAHWQNVTVVSLSGLGLTALSVEITQLPLLQKLYLDNNKLLTLPSELGSLKNLKVLAADHNMLVSVPVELRQCNGLVELSLERNKLVRPLLDFRAMAELRVLRLFGNPLEFLPDILLLHELRHLSLANIRIEADENLGSVNVKIEMENSSYFASKHKLSEFFSLIFRFSSCHHPLLASALAKIMQEEGNRVVVGKDETALRQLISMISSENQHVVEQACSALSALASDIPVAIQLMKLDIMQPIERVLITAGSEKVISILQVVVKLASTSDIVSQRMMTKDILKSLKLLCGQRNPEVQRLALFAVGNLAFCLENRRALVTSESLRDLLLRLTLAADTCVRKAAARALAILGENEVLRRAIKGRQVPKRGLRMLTMDGGGMKGLATVKILKEIEKGTGRKIHELFDLICGTSTGGMLAVALGIKLMSLEKCEEIYKELGKLVFSNPVPKDNEAATWREKLDQLYKSSSQSFRVVVHGSKHSADEFERLLKEMCADEEGDLLIESAVKRIPKVFVVSTLVSVVPAQPFIFRNYQYPAGTPEVSSAFSENMTTTGAQIGSKRNAFLGSCKHHLWQAIRASSAAPYYLDDFSDGVYRWQDGAIVANNPTIFAIREAQLLWPDAKIDCLVSIGCGSIPTKVRKGGWRYLDTGQVLIESACSVDRVEEALSSLLSMLPEVRYFRFNPVDERCDIELDETDPAVWLQLEDGTDDYIKNNSVAFKDLIDRLLESQHDDKFSDGLKPLQLVRPQVSNESSPSLGRRRGVLLVEASNSPDSGRAIHHTRELDTFCASNGIRLSLTNASAGPTKAAPASTPLPTPGSTFPTPYASPLLTGSFPSSPLIYSPDVGGQRVGRIDLIPHLSLEGFYSAKTTVTPPDSPPKRRQLPIPVVSLHEKIQNLPQVGVLHLALQNDMKGAILSWQNDVYVVAEPGELASKFLQNVKNSMLSTMKGSRRKYASVVTNISTIADLVSCRPNFQVGSVGHRYIGHQTQVMDDDQEISAYMFRRTVPSEHLTPEDVHCMVGDWRDRIIIFTGLCGPTQALTKSLLDSGAKAVVCPSTEPEEVQLTSSTCGHCDVNSYEIGRFEIGVEEAEDEETETATPASDWEDSDSDKNGECSMRFWEEDEKELSQFVSKFYDSLFQGGARVDVALKNVLTSHKRLRFSCHLPGIP